MKTEILKQPHHCGINSAPEGVNVIANIVGAVVMYFAAIPARIENSARPDQQIPSIPPLLHLYWALFFYIGGLSAATWFAATGRWLLIPVCWVAVVHGSRKLQVNLGHACSHGTLTGDKHTDRLIGLVIHALTLATAFDVYAPRHRDEHHPWSKLATKADPTWQSMAGANLKPGVPKAELYRRLMKAFFSPAYHLRVFQDRLVSHLEVPGTYRVCFMTGLALVAAMITIRHGWIPFAEAFLVPVVWGYQTSQLLRLCVEHRLPEGPGAPRSGYYLHELTDEYILQLGSPLDMFIRVTCLTGDTLRHALHHYHPTSMDWADYVSSGPRARALAIAQGRPGQYNEVVGFRAALDRCFEALSKTSEEQS